MVDTQTILDGSESVARDADAETWFAFPRSLNRLLRLLATRKTTYVLSGDVHYSYVYDVPQTYYLDTAVFTLKAMTVAADKSNFAGRPPSRLVNVVCSPLQNEWKDDNVRTLKEYGGQHFVDESGRAIVNFVTPQRHPWRDLFQLPETVWTADARPVDALPDRPRAYGTRNCIAVATWQPQLEVTFLGIGADNRLKAVGSYVAPPRGR